MEGSQPPSLRGDSEWRHLVLFSEGPAEPSSSWEGALVLASPSPSSLPHSHAPASGVHLPRQHLHLILASGSALGGRRAKPQGAQPLRGRTGPGWHKQCQVGLQPNPAPRAGPASQHKQRVLIHFLHGLRLSGRTFR